MLHFLDILPRTKYCYRALRVSETAARDLK